VHLLRLLQKWAFVLRPRGVRAYFRGIKARARFWKSYEDYLALVPGTDKPRIDNFFPCLFDNIGETPIDATYYYQDSWAFERIVQARPKTHIDVGSHHKFVSLLSKVVPTTVVDLRPLSVQLDSLKFVEGSILNLPFDDGSVHSLSSLCVVEHIGLGRYGDPLDPDGSEKAFAELMRIVAPGGNLYISVPIDDSNRTYFNAHRAFREDYLLGVFSQFNILEKRYIYGTQFGDKLKAGFGTGCYHLRRPLAPAITLSNPA
jgi:SAM-dependent methyltransferase